MKHTKKIFAIIGFFLLTAGINHVFAQANTSMSDKITSLIAEHESNHPAPSWIPGNDSVPMVPKAFERNVGRAWAAAIEGNPPTQHCTGFFNGMGMRLGNENTEDSDLNDSMQAIDVCYAGVMAQFLSASLAKVTDGNHNCIGEMTATNNHRQVATSLLQDNDAQGTIIAYLDSRLNIAIGDQVRELCPEYIADIILPAVQ